MEAAKSRSGIGSLNEKPLHAALKARFAGPNDELEVAVDGFVIDIRQGELLVEIQTRNLGAMKRKLTRLTTQHKVRLIYPIAQEKWIVKEGVHAGRRRKSPKRGAIDLVFEELVSFPKLLANPNFSLLVLLIREEEVRGYDPKRAWRRKGWVTLERRLIDVVEDRLIESPEDLLAFLPSTLPVTFTTADLAAAAGRPRWLAQKMAYCLRELGVICPVGTRKRAILYRRATAAERMFLRQASA